MSADLIETLPIAQRLVLAYAPRAARSDALALLALDARLAGIVRSGGEPVIAQLKLAWWRERLVQSPQDWPLGEPLLALLRQGKVDAAMLEPLVDGWEALLAERLDEKAIDSFANGRAALWQSFAMAHAGKGEGAVQPAREHAITDLALNLGTQHEAALAREHAQAQAWTRPRLPRALRPLLILHGLSHRALKRGSADLLDGPGAMLTVLRLGIAGQ